MHLCFVKESPIKSIYYTLNCRNIFPSDLLFLNPNCQRLLYEPLPAVWLTFFSCFCFSFINWKGCGKNAFLFKWICFYIIKQMLQCDPFQANSSGNQLQAFSYFTAMLYCWSKTLQGGIKYACYSFFEF